MNLLRAVRPAVAVLLATSLLTLSACKDDAVSPDDEPEVASMRLVIGGQTITISDAGVVSPATPLVLPLGGTTITAAFLKANGEPNDNVTTADFQLNVTIGSGIPVTFTRSTTNAFAGTLNVTGIASGVQLRFALFHIEEQHEDFGPFPVTFTLGR